MIKKVRLPLFSKNNASNSVYLKLYSLLILYSKFEIQECGESVYPNDHAFFYRNEN